MRRVPVTISTHSDGDAHARDANRWLVDRRVAVTLHVPPAGSSELSTLRPPADGKAQNETVGHDPWSTVSPRSGEAAASVHADGPPAGSVDTKTPREPPATHSRGDGHAMPSSGFVKHPSDAQSRSTAIGPD